MKGCHSTRRVALTALIIERRRENQNDVAVLERFSLKLFLWERFNEVKMLEGRYLLSIEALLEKVRVLSKEEWDTYISILCELLDEERSAKVRRMKLPRKQAESLGAGLLLQYAVQEALTEENVLHRNGEKEVLQADFSRKLEPNVLSVGQLLDVVKQPMPFTYTYGPQGKPYLKGMPIYFNLSHSGEYIFCAVSGQEIGADIQFMENKVSEQIVRRFFAVEEQEALKECGTDEARKELFYGLWCRKEAYGKLTGQGVAGVLGMNFLQNEMVMLQNEEERVKCEKNETIEENIAEKLEWEEYNLAGEYKIVVCQWK